MTKVIADRVPEQDDSWTAAEIEILYDNDGEPDVREVRVTLEELQEEKREEFKQRGMPEQQADEFVLDPPTFQGMVFNAARNLAVSPLFQPVEDSDSVRVIPPWKISEVIVRPQERSRILTPTQQIHVPRN